MSKRRAVAPAVAAVASTLLLLGCGDEEQVPAGGAVQLCAAQPGRTDANRDGIWDACQPTPSSSSVTPSPSPSSPTSPPTSETDGDGSYYVPIPIPDDDYDNDGTSDINDPERTNPNVYDDDQDSDEVPDYNDSDPYDPDVYDDDYYE